MFKRKIKVGELQALRFANVVNEKGQWSFKINNIWSDYINDFTGALKAGPKGYSRILLLVPESLIILLKQFQIKQKSFLENNGITNENDLVFINLRDYKTVYFGKPIKQRSINDMFKSICERADIQANGKKLSIYSFRHTICTKLANTPGMSYPWASEKMRHSLQMFMNTYVGVDPSIEDKMTQLWVG